ETRPGVDTAADGLLNQQGDQA
ncbi:MAG: hypothetical protein JWR13_4659, partial [Mycobacterium sp.]|nr:hypothetical protein [Mycobacterium sp.]